MGQCHPLPDNEPLKEEMRLHARNHARIFNMYNFDYDPSPKSDLVKAWKLFAKKVVRLPVHSSRISQQIKASPSAWHLAVLTRAGLTYV